MSRDKAKVLVQAENAFSKRYLKYLSKKYLKKQQVPLLLTPVSLHRATLYLAFLPLWQGRVMPAVWLSVDVRW